MRNLIAAGLIAPGDVDERSIENVQAVDLAGYDQCHFFAGIGVWSYALRLAGWPDDRPVWTGSCPCQPFSAAGKQRGFADERHLWPEFYRLIRECRPAIVLGEQVGGPAGLAWWDTVCNDLEKRNYACGAVDFPAASIGAPHIRQRLYWCGLAHTGRDGRQRRVCGRQDAQRETLDRPAGRDGATGGLVYPDGDRRGAGEWDNQTVGYRPAVAAAGEPRPTGGFWADIEWLWCRDGKYRPVKPGLEPLVDGFAGRGALLRCLGNAIVAPQAARFVKTVMEFVK